MGDLLALRGLNMDLQMGHGKALIATLQIRPVLGQRIQEVQDTDPNLAKIKEQIQQGGLIPYSPFRMVL